MKIFDRLKKLSSIALLLCVATQVQAADIDLATAQSKARSFMTKQVANGRLKAAAAANLKLVKSEASVVDPKAVDYYIFNSDKAYVVVSGEDQAPEILMYGEEGNVNLDRIPPAMQWLLNKYKYQIEGLREGTLKPNSYSPKATAVAPLVTANWDQTAPYYNHTPTSGSTHAYTGCPATSLSMCFYKYKWPATYPALSAIAANSYYGYLAAPALSEKAADWDNMLDEYTGPTNYTYNNTQAEAVSWLMRYVGQACNMGYSTSGSGANDPEILEACHTFGYTDAQLLTLTELVSSGWSYTNSSQYYTDSQWNEWMLAELYAGRPIEYLAYDITSGQVSGHAFNVFGCNSSGQYYVNWGWSGDSNGYCTLHNFTTATGATGQSGSYTFKYGEAMIIGIAPPADALGPQITADPTTLAFEGYVGETYTKTFTVTGTNLEGNITVSKQGSSIFTVSPTTITAANAANGVQVTVTYKPTAAGSTSAYITLSSSNAESVTVNVTGTAQAKTPTLTVDPTTLSFTNCYVGDTYTKTFNVSGVYLTNNVTITRSGSSLYSSNVSSITATNAANGVDVTITYAPTAAGSSNATFTIASTGAESKTVTVNGTAQAKIPTLTVDPTSLSLNASTGTTVSKTFNVTGKFISDNVTVSLTDANGVFSVSPATIAAGSISETTPVAVTVSFNSAEEGDFTGTVTIASDGAESKTVALTANASDGGTASDAYLDIAKYATIDEAGATVSGMSTIYKYTEYLSDNCAWLTVSSYGAKQADANQNWLETTSLSQYNNSWSASDIFLGQTTYFGSNTAYSIYGSGNQSFYVTNCSQVKAYVKGSSYSSSSASATLSIYECTVNANGSLTPATTATSTVQGSNGVITSAELDDSKIYKVQLTGGGSYPDLLEVGFKTELYVPKPELPINVEADPSTTTADISWTPGENNEGWNLRWRLYDQESGEEEVVFSESFENGLGNWTLVNTDGDSYNWQAVDLTSNFSGQFTAKDGSYVAMSRSWISSSIGAVTPDQWLISPQIENLGGILKYYIMDDGKNYQENYRIYVSTTGNSISDFVPVTDDMQSPNVASWTEVTIDLSSYKDQAGYIAFRHYDCTDKDFMFIDALTLTTIPGAQWNYVYDVTSPYTITGLTPATTYEAQVQGKNEYGTTAWTASTIFTTLAGGSTVAGDVNGDGEVTTVDITVLYNWLLNGDDTDMVNGDQNGDGEITTNDVTFVYNILLGIDN